MQGFKEYINEEMLTEKNFRIKGLYRYQSVDGYQSITTDDSGEVIYDNDNFFDDFEKILNNSTNPTLVQRKIELPQVLQDIKDSFSNKRDKDTLDVMFETLKHNFIQDFYSEYGLQKGTGKKRKYGGKGHTDKRVRMRGKRGNYYKYLPREKSVG